MDQICCQLIDQDVKVPVQFGQALTRFRLVIDNETGQQRFGIGLSHAQYDVFCIDAFLSELVYVCLGRPDLKQPPSYSRFLKYPHLVSQNPETDAFWARVLKDSKMTTVDKPPKTRVAPLDQHVMRVEVPVGKRSGGMTAAVVIKSAWSLVLSQFSKYFDVIFGSIVSGRHGFHLTAWQRLLGHVQTSCQCASPR